MPSRRKSPHCAHAWPPPTPAAPRGRSKGWRPRGASTAPSGSIPPRPGPRPKLSCGGFSRESRSRRSTRPSRCATSARPRFSSRSAFTMPRRSGAASRCAKASRGSRTPASARTPSTWPAGPCSSMTSDHSGTQRPTRCGRGSPKKRRRFSWRSSPPADYAPSLLDAHVAFARDAMGRHLTTNS